MAKLVDALDLGSSAARRGGSIPFRRTKKRLSEAGLSVSVFADRYGNQNPAWSLMTDRVDHCICKQMHGCQGNLLSG